MYLQSAGQLISNGAHDTGAHVCWEANIPLHEAYFTFTSRFYFSIQTLSRKIPPGSIRLDTNPAFAIKSRFQIGDVDSLRTTSPQGADAIHQHLIHVKL